MDTDREIRCRVAACLEPGADGKEWSFYVLNDSQVPLDRVVLKTFGHEWGDDGPAIQLDVEVNHIAPGGNALIWRDNDDEMRMWLTLLIEAGGRKAQHMFEFPMLYKRKGQLPMVAELGKPGWVVSATGTP